MSRCRACNGSGEGLSGRFCGFCGGDGEIEHELPEPDDETTPEYDFEQ